MIRKSWFRVIDKNRDDVFDFAEFATSNHRTDPVGTLLNLDKDLNGRLTREEFEGLPAHWKPDSWGGTARSSMMTGWGYSLREYQFTARQLLANWQSAQDDNNDGKLSQEEFRFLPGARLATLFGASISPIGCEPVNH